MTKLVYLSGKSRAGKDEVTKIWCKLCPSFTKMAFADEIKKKTSDILGVKLEDLSDPATKEKYRAFLIFGGQLVRSIDSNYWVKKVVGSDSFRKKDVIISDVRFLNEMNELDYLGGYYGKEVISINVFANQDIRVVRGANPEFFNDKSETDLDCCDSGDFDWRIANNGTLQELEANVKFIFKEMGWPVK